MNENLRLHDGYYIIRWGNNKGRPLQNVIMEERIGRKLKSNEVVHHDNEIRTDNSDSNLILMTRSEHRRVHTYRTIAKGTSYDISKESKIGELHNKAKLRESDVISIFNDSDSYEKIAIKYKVTKSCIKHIKRGRNWKHLKLKPL